jgi:HEPN domain-containing protein
MSNQPETAKLWFKKAQNDLKTGRDEFQTDEPATDTICFHMQQAVEKYP